MEQKQRSENKHSWKSKNTQSRVKDIPGGAKPGEPGYSPLMEASATNKYLDKVRENVQKYKVQVEPSTQVQSTAQGMHLTKSHAIKGELGYFAISQEGYDSFLDQLSYQFQLFRKPECQNIDIIELRRLCLLAIVQQWAQFLPSCEGSQALLTVDVFLPQPITKAIQCLGKVNTSIGSLVPLHQKELIYTLTFAVLNDTRTVNQIKGPFKQYDQFKFLQGSGTTQLRMTRLVDKQKFMCNNNQVIDFVEYLMGNYDLVKVINQLVRISHAVRASYQCERFQTSPSGNAMQFVTKDGYAIYPLSTEQMYTGVATGITAYIEPGDGFIISTVKSQEERRREWFKQDEIS